MTEHVEPDIETLLSQLRRWLQETRAEVESEAETTGREPSWPEAEPSDVGLYRLVEEFTALRHELKLQTRSARGLQEQAEALLPAFRQAIEQFRAVAPREAQAVWSAAKPLAEALADLDEALERGHDEIVKARQRLLEEPTRLLLEALDALHARQSWFRRRRTRSYHEQARVLVQQEGAQLRRDLLDALLEGYRLILARLRRALAAEDVQRIDRVGQPVDPELMNVVALVDDPDRPPGQVVEEIRRGYTWRGRVLRYAEVRASRSPTTLRDGPAEPEPESEPDQGRVRSSE